MSAKVSPVPEGYHTVTPYLVVRDPAGAIDLYKKAFGAEEVMCMHGPDGKSIMHAEIKIGDSMIMLSGEWPDQGNKAPLPNHTSSSLHVYVADVDKAFQRAISAGCTAKFPVTNMFWGDRFGKVVDPYGHTWSLATHVEDVAPEECARRAAAWKPG